MRPDGVFTWPELCGEPLTYDDLVSMYTRIENPSGDDPDSIDAKEFRADPIAVEPLGALLAAGTLCRGAGFRAIRRRHEPQATRRHSDGPRRGHGTSRRTAANASSMPLTRIRTTASTDNPRSVHHQIDEGANEHGGADEEGGRQEQSA